ARAAAHLRRSRALADAVGRADPGRDRRGVGARRVPRRRPRRGHRPVRRAARQAEPACAPPDQEADARDARRAQRRARGGGVRSLSHLRGRAGGRRSIPREARARLDRQVRAVVLREVGGDLALEDWDEPGGTVVDVRAAGVNFADVLIRRGLYPQMPELPYVLGNEVAGELEGRRVLALPRSAGGYAERVEVDPDWVFDLPENASYAAGASFLTTYLTAHIPLGYQLHISAGSSVLVHAGSGGVGVAAIQLAKLRGAHVVATASSHEKREYARSVGADEVRDYDEIDDLRVDAVIDPVGGDVFTRSLPL